MYFKYKYNAGADQDAIVALWDSMHAYYTQLGTLGPVLANLTFAHTADGWEAWEAFPNADAYEQHAKNTMAYPKIGDVFAMQSQWTEVEGLICGPEAEIAKSPSIKEYYPTQKRVFKEVDVPKLAKIGWKNKKIAKSTKSAVKPGEILWFFGRPGAGKTFLSDYLAT